MDNNYMNPQATEGALGWNDEITKDDEFELLPAGVYDFKIESLERGYFDGSDTHLFKAYRVIGSKFI